MKKRAAREDFELSEKVKIDLARMVYRIIDRCRLGETSEGKTLSACDLYDTKQLSAELNTLLVRIYTLEIERLKWRAS